MLYYSKCDRESLIDTLILCSLPLSLHILYAEAQRTGRDTSKERKESRLFQTIPFPPSRLKAWEREWICGCVCLQSLRIKSQFFWRLSLDGPPARCLHSRPLVRPVYICNGLHNWRCFGALHFSRMSRAKPTQPPARSPKSAVSSSQLWAKRNERVCCAAGAITVNKLPPATIGNMAHS